MSLTAGVFVVNNTAVFQSLYKYFTNAVLVAVSSAELVDIQLCKLRKGYKHQKEKTTVR